MHAENEEEKAVVAKALAKHRARKLVGRPSRAVETMSVVHLAAQLTRTMTQRRVIRATTALFDHWHESDLTCIAPAPRVVRQYVKAYLLWRKDPKVSKNFPRYIQLGIEGLPISIQWDAFVGFVGTHPNGPTIRGDQQAVALTQRVRALRTLPK